MPMKEWLATEYTRLEEPLECMQRAGDVNFVPYLNGNGTRNVQESIGEAVEIRFFTRFA